MNDMTALRGELRQSEPMREHTTWRVGGPADRAYFPADAQDLAQFLRGLPDTEPVFLAGLGSNLLVRDGGLRGTVIFTHGALHELRLDAQEGETGVVYAEAGVPSAKAARFAARQNLVGAEFLAGIPGTIGGALAMNAGCYGGETWRLVEKVCTVSRSGELRERRPDEYDVGYRHVALQGGSEEWFVGAWLRLPVGDGAASLETMKELLARRSASQPLAQPNAGSVFRNPQGDYAARLIEACGLKGETEGGAQVSLKHANFIVNLGGATARDIETLIGRVQDRVKAQFGVELLREVKIVGEP